MQESGYLPTWVQFHELISKQQFPMDNISFRLFLDVVKFMTTSSTTHMRNSPQVKQFWLAGYKLFHGRFLRFMSGPKSLGQAVQDESMLGYFDPKEAEINFAVPSVNHLKKTDLSFEDTVSRPGILDGSLSAAASGKKQIKICFDGKKINSSLTNLTGDIDLFGCEPSPTLQERKSRQDNECDQIEMMIKRAENFGNETITKETVIEDI